MREATAILFKRMLDPRVASKLEEAIYVQSRKDKDKNYVKWLVRARHNLAQPCEGAEGTVKQAFADGDLTSEEVLLWAGKLPARARMRALFNTVLKGGGRLDAGACRGYAARLERACYDAALLPASPEVHLTSEIFREDPQSPAFMAAYAERCGAVLIHLDVQSSVCRQHGTYALDRLAGGAWTPEELAALPQHDMCPAATLDDRERIELRRQQKIDEKTSNMYKCPVCKQRACTYREVQIAGADEAGKIVCRCVCGNQFYGR